MSNFRLEAKVHGRGGGGSSVVKAAAYRAAEKLSEREPAFMGAVADRSGAVLEAGGEVFDFSRKRGVLAAEIHLPQGAAERLEDRGTLWREADAKETRVNSRLAREVIVSIPRELSREQGLDAVRGFVNEQIVEKGAAADVCLHEVKARDGGRNFHAHVLYTTREVGPDGLGKKIREFDRKAHVVEMRAAWADHANWALEQAGREQRVDHRSLKEQAKEALEKRDFAKLAKVDREPTVYLKRVDFEREQRGEASSAVAKKREVAARNAERAALYDRIGKLGDRAREAFTAARAKLGDIVEAADQWRQHMGLGRARPSLDEQITRAGGASAERLTAARKERDHGHER